MRAPYLTVVLASFACSTAPRPAPEPLRVEAAPELEPGSSCRIDDDCVFSGVDHVIEREDDCRISCCSGTLMNRVAAQRFQAAFRRVCSARPVNLPAPCASTTCELRGTPRCIRGRCAEMNPDAR